MAWWASDTAPSGSRVVSESSATCLAPVFASIRHIVDYSASLPVDAFRANPDGTRSPLGSLPQLLRSQDAMGAPGLNQWIGQAFYGIAVHGNAVGWVTKFDGFGFPADVWWLRRQDWAFDRMNRQWRVYGQPVPSSQVVHIPWIVPSGCVLGLSPIEHAAAMIGAGLSAQEYADVRRGGGIPPAVLKNNALSLDPDQSAAVRDRAVQAFSTGKPFVTGKDWELDVTTIPPNHAQFIETLRLSANHIAAMYGIDPREIGGTADGSLTYTNDESRALNRAHNMRPYIVRFEQAINRLLPERQFVKLNADATIRADIKTQTEVLGAQIVDGRMSVNEARALKDLPPVKGGDFHNVPTPKPEVAPATRIGDTP